MKKRAPQALLKSLFILILDSINKHKQLISQFKQIQSSQLYMRERLPKECRYSHSGGTHLVRKKGLTAPSKKMQEPKGTQPGVSLCGYKQPSPPQ